MLSEKLRNVHTRDGLVSIEVVVSVVQVTRNNERTIASVDSVPSSRGPVTIVVANGGIDGGTSLVADGPASRSEVDEGEENKEHRVSSV